MIVGTWVWDGDGHHRVEDWPGALSDRRAAEQGLVWVGLDDPDPGELKQLAGELGLHPLAVEDAEVGGQRPKVDRYEDSLLVVLRPLDYDPAHDQVETRELTLFVGPHYVVSVRRGGHTPLQDVRYGLDTGPVELRASPVGALHGVLDHVVDHYVDIAGALADDLDQIEDRVFAGAQDADATAIYALKREVQEARRAMAPLIAPLTALAQGGVRQVPADARPFFADVLDHLVRASESVEGYERSLTDVLNVHLAQVGVQQNDDNRKISAWAAIGLVPTVVGGIYGMNFEHMPELGWSFGYPAALAVIAGACLGLHRAFKRSGWL